MTDNLILEYCCKCKEPFGIHRQTRDVFLRSHQTFYCPFGHQQHYVEGESEIEKLRRERNLLKQRQAQKDDRIRELQNERQAVERKLAAKKGVITRLKNRAKAGVCPCCNRTFQNLQKHMAGQHPNFTEETDD